MPSTARLRLPPVTFLSQYIQNPVQAYVGAVYVQKHNTQYVPTDTLVLMQEDLINFKQGPLKRCKASCSFIYKSSEFFNRLAHSCKSLNHCSVIQKNAKYVIMKIAVQSFNAKYHQCPHITFQYCTSIHLVIWMETAHTVSLVRPHKLHGCQMKLSIFNLFVAFSKPRSPSRTENVSRTSNPSARKATVPSFRTSNRFTASH